MSALGSMLMIFGTAFVASSTLANEPKTIGSLLGDGYDFVPFSSAGGMGFALSDGNSTFVCLNNEHPTNQERLVWSEEVREGRTPDAPAPPFVTACVEVH